MVDTKASLHSRTNIFKKIFHFLTFQTSTLPKTVAKKTKNMTSFPCSVCPEKFHPYTFGQPKLTLLKITMGVLIFINIKK